MRSWLVALSTRLYRALIVTYPPTFRRAFAGPMTQVFRDQCLAAMRRRGVVGVVAFVPASLFDLLRGAWSERFHPFKAASNAPRGSRSPRSDRGSESSAILSIVRDTLQDVRYALRMFAKRPGLVAAAVVTLALGIGANTALFSVVNGVLLRPLPYPEPDQLISLQRIRPNGLIGQLSYPDVVTVRQQTTVFSEMTAYAESVEDLVGIDQPVRIRIARVTAGFFDVLGVIPAMGRSLIPGDHGREGRPVAILGYAAWQQRFGADPDIVGRTINLRDRAYTIVGVLGPEDLDFPNIDTELWVPTFSNFGVGSFWLFGMGRLAGGATVRQAQAELDVIADRIATEYPDIYTDREFTVRDLRESMVGDVRGLLLVLFGAVGLVLLIAAANVANLLLVRATERQREMAMRVALGAGQMRVARQLLTESVMLAVGGALAGLLVARWITALLLRLGPTDLPRKVEIGLDANVLLFTALVAVGTGLVFGVAPVLQLPMARLSDALRDGATGSGTGRQRLQFRHGLAVLQVALSCMLIVGAGLLVKSFWRLSHVDPGFRVDNVLAFRVSIPASRYPDARSIGLLHDELGRSLRALPGVERVAGVSLVPFHGGNWCNTLTIEANPENEMSCAEFRTSSPGYFDLMGMTRLQGRDFVPSDDGQSSLVTIVNETTARLGWPGQNPLGKRLEMQGTFREIVGVVSDVRQFGLDRGVQPEVYVPQAQFPLRYARYVLRTTMDPVALMPVVRARVWSVDPNLPLAEFSTLETMVSDSVSEPRFRMVFLGGTALLALALSVVGLFAVMAFSVSRHTREIGIRVALGARRSRVLGEVLQQGARLIIAGAVIGVLGSVAATRVLRAFLFEIEPTDPWVFLSGVLVVAATAFLACYLPARRATRVDPVIALRYE